MRGLKLRETSIGKIISDSCHTLYKPDSVSVEITCNLDDEAVWIDHERIFKALVDLETNAIEAMPEGGRLIVLAEGNQDLVFITIRDTGEGISKENMDQLFTPFFSTKPAGEGTGLGLPSAYGVVKAHGGELTIESNADPSQGPTGTTVRLTLPRRMILKNIKGTLIIHDE